MKRALRRRSASPRSPRSTATTSGACARCGTATAATSSAGLVAALGRGAPRAPHVLGDALLPARACCRRARASARSSSSACAGSSGSSGARPTGAWLAECAYHPSFDDEIARAGIRFTIARHPRRPQRATRGRPSASTRPSCSPSGVAFFARDAESSRQVWSRDEGYPGDAFYRDFYRDIGFDLPESRADGRGRGRRLAPDDGAQVLPHHRQGRREAAVPAGRRRASARASTRATSSSTAPQQLEAPRAGTMPVPPIVVAPYDAELYGHWWFEGPLFLEAVFRTLRETRGRASRPITLRGVPRAPPGLRRRRRRARASWGAGGYGEVWVGHEAAWTWRHVHHATRYASWLVDKHRARRRAARRRRSTR